MSTHRSRISVVAAAVTVLAALFWWFGFSVVIAQQPPHHVFVGTAAVNGKPMADGNPVTAWINGDMVGKSVVDGGTYALLVIEPWGRSFDEKNISFKIGNLEAHEVANWEQGGSTELHLTAAVSGSNAVDLTSIPEKSPGHIFVDCAQNIQPACQNYDGGQHGDGAFQERQPVIREAEVRHTAVGGEHTPDIRQSPLTPMQTDQTVRRLKTQAQREEDRLSQESDRQESRLKTRRLELQSQRELEQRRISQEQRRSGREAQLDLERQRLEPEYPKLGIFLIDGPADQVRKPAGSLPRLKKSSGRGFFTNSANGDVGGIDRILDPTLLAVIGILLTLVATSTSLFKGD